MTSFLQKIAVDTYLNVSFSFLEVFSKPAETLEHIIFFSNLIFLVLLGKGQKIGKSLEGYTKQEYFEFKCGRHIAFLIKWELASNPKHVLCYDL